MHVVTITAKRQATLPAALCREGFSSGPEDGRTPDDMRAGSWTRLESRPRPTVNRRAAMRWLTWVLLVAPIALASAGCFLAPGSPARPDPAGPVSGPAPYVEGCQTCHAAPVGAHYAQSLHTVKGIRCGQCHTPGDHPNFTQPIRDGKCGGCHQPQYQETLASTHFTTRDRRALDDDRAARTALRQEHFTAAATAGGRRFVGDSSSGELGGRLCAACHYDEHRLGLGAVRRADFCTGCHAGREEHFPILTPGLTNRCVQCHVRAGQTASGQVVNTHRFALPGAEGTGR